jgi:hypothetical protein
MTSPDTLPLSSQRRLTALSGVAFGVLLLFGWFLSGGNTPDYTAPDAEWVAWAEDTSQLSGIAGFLILLAGVALLHFAGTIRSALGTAETTLQGSVDLARVAFAGAIVGGACLPMAIVMVAAATSPGAAADPVVSRAVSGVATAGPYLVAAMGFVALLGSAGLSTLRTGVFPRWTGIVALIGAVAFLITFATVLVGTHEDSVFGYGFLPGILSLVIWSIATSIASYRATATTTPELVAPEADS